MKKHILLFGLSVGLFFGAVAQCTIDTTQVTAGKFFSPDTLPCVVRTVAYDQVIQFKVPVSVNIQDFVSIPIPYTVFVDSIVIDSIGGFPAGIGYTLNPTDGHFKPGVGGCARLSGTTTDPKGNYPLTVYGNITVRGQPQPLVGFDGDTTLDLSNLAQLGNSPFSFNLDVINIGDQCRPSNVGIGAVAAFNAIIKAYPNPTQNRLTVDVNTVDRINGKIEVFNALGSRVVVENVDWIGAQSYQINTSALPNGVYILRIADTYKAFQTQFVVAK
jgi:hypothetical protein